MCSPRETDLKLRAHLPLVGHSKCKTLCMLILVPSPVNPLYVSLSCGFKMEREQENHEVFHFPTDIFNIELGAFFSNQDYLLWFHLKLFIRIHLWAHSITLSLIKYYFSAYSVLGARAQWEANTQHGNLTLLATSPSMFS